MEKAARTAAFGVISMQKFCVGFCGSCGFFVHLFRVFGFIYEIPHYSCWHSWLCFDIIGNYIIDH